LRRYFGREQAVEVLQLAPLTRQQVRQAAEAHALDAEALETAVERAEAQLTYDETDNGCQRLRLRDVTDEPLLFADKAAPIPDHAAVRELVEHCGLFVATAAGSRWVHPVFADYLAAWALHQAAIPPAQLRNLLRA
nr:hypothetical protein [Tanacetum cinerariifolium]